MQHFIIYLLQAALSLAVLHGIYRLFAHRETFHRLNRWILLGSLLASVLLPLISIPAIGRETAGIVGGFSTFLLPVVVTPADALAASAPEASGVISLWQVAGWIYLTVSSLLLLRLLFQLAGISRLIFTTDRVPQDGCQLIISEKVHTPFSFFRYIFLNPETLGGSDSRQILDHEEVHSRQLHSIDNLLSELYALVFWFSPVSWWHKKELLLNLEYLADRGALENGCEPREYQFQLLKASLGDARYALTNHFAQSIIKRRIKMMNTEPSPLKRAWKYLMLIPAAAAALFLLNCTGEIAPDKQAEHEVEYDQEVILGEVIEDSVSNDEDLISEVLATLDTSHNGTAYNFAEIDKKPVFPGGNDQIMNYVFKNIRYPENASAAGIEGTVYVQFTISENGSVRNAVAVRGAELGGGLAAEALRVVKNMPAWTPGEQQGEKVPVSYTLPIFFRLAKSEPPAASGQRKDSYSFAEVDRKPQFPGGNEKIMDYIGRNFIFPAEAQEKNIQGTVFIQFIIEKDGSISNVRCVRGEDLGGGLAREGVRVVSSMPDWTPGEHQGEKVAVSYTLPIFAKIQE